MPVDPLGSARAHKERAVTITQPGEEGAAAFLPQHVPGGAARNAERMLDHARQIGRDGAEEAARGVADFIDGVAGFVGDIQEMAEP